MKIICTRECIETVRTFEHFEVEVPEGITSSEEIDEWIMDNHWEFYGDIEYDEMLDNQLEDITWSEK